MKIWTRPLRNRVLLKHGPYSTLMIPLIGIGRFGFGIVLTRRNRG